MTSQTQNRTEPVGNRSRCRRVVRIIAYANGIVATVARMAVRHRLSTSIVLIAHAPNVYPAPTQTALIDGWIVQAQYRAVWPGASTSSGPNTAVSGTRERNTHRASGESRSSPAAMVALCRPG